MSPHPKSKVIALRALLAVIKEEERRLLITINSEQTPPDEMSSAISDIYKLWSRMLLKLADIEEQGIDLARSFLISAGEAVYGLEAMQSSSAKAIQCFVTRSAGWPATSMTCGE